MTYLFWWQAVIEIAANFSQLLRLKLPLRIAFAHLKHVAFLLGIYFIFIMVIFGIIFSYSNSDLFTINVQVFAFRNTSFVINILLFLGLTTFSLLRSKNPEVSVNAGIFTPKLIILHMSIVLGAFLHFGIRHFYPESFNDSIYPYFLSAIPFLLLQTYFAWKTREVTS